MGDRQTSNSRPYFSFYDSFRQAIDLLPIDERLNIYDSIVRYGLDREEPELDNPMSRLAWVQIKAALDSQWTKYNNGCKGAEYGKLGGAPKGNNNAQKSKTTPKQRQNNPNRIEKNRIEEEKKDIIAASDDVKNNQFSIALKERFSTLAKFKDSLTEGQYNKLCEKHGKEAVNTKMLALDNTIGAEKKYKSVYKTLSVWMRK